MTSLLDSQAHLAGQKANPKFAQRLQLCPTWPKSSSRPTGRQRFVFVPYDQLTDEIGPLAEYSADPIHLVLIESQHTWQQRPYHKQKIALVLANMRQFALEQQAKGRHVLYLWTDRPMAEILAILVQEMPGLSCMEPAERELRLALPKEMVCVPHTGFLSLASDLQILGAPPWRHDGFYRGIRRRLGILMDGDRPVGGRFSFDSENRLPWKGEPKAPKPCVFDNDEITKETLTWIAQRYSKHPGRLDGSALPTTAADSQRLWRWAQTFLPHFGPFEDAMSQESRGLFHTKVSALLNLCRLLPRQLIADSLKLSHIPLPSLEGFVRQVIGWREFVYQIHRQTDGLRRLPTRNYFAVHHDLPAAYWGKASGLACLDTVVASVWDEGYSHHITRLMILGNLATLLDIDPEQVNHWFWVAYTDAYDWVVEPNVLGMATHALGDQMMTKPYISGSGYIAKMSDYCQQCAFHPKKNCPITPMYWAFLRRHREKLMHNPRMAIPFAGLKRRAVAQQQQDERVFLWASKQLQAGRPLRPAELPKD